MMRRWLGCALFLLPLLLWGQQAFGSQGEGTAPAEGPEPVVRRFALVVGANDGGSDRVRLRYAGTDALAVARVLSQLGGVAPEDEVVLLDGTRETLSLGLDQLAGLLAGADPSARTELFFYYSGHSDETGLLMGGERIPYSELREALAALPADVRIAVLDSCASGAFTRLKGGTRASPFLVDGSVEVRGHAFLTSSSEDEASQESDRLGGSYFTYALVSGLRGAADHTGDGRVSLNEIYQFAFHETLRRTESTLGGAQHPGYEIQLAGSGDLVLTDLRGVEAGLVLDDAIDGRISIRNAEGRLEVELRKFAGRPVTLGLEAGGYTVLWEDGAALREAVVLLGEGGTMQLLATDFVDSKREVAVARGGTRLPDPADGEPRGRTLRLVPVNLSFVPPLDVNTWRRGPDLNHLSLFLLGGRSHAVDGLSLGFGLSVVDSMRGVQVASLNWAGVLDGVQVGFVNMAREARGAQVGFVNVGGTMDGVMVGVVNVAEDAEFAFGLLNFIKRGLFHVDVWASESELVNVGVRFGARHTYTLLGGGFSPLGDPHGVARIGFGVRLPQVGPLVMDLDGTTGLVIDASGRNKQPSFTHSLRMLINLRVAPHFGFFFGPTVNLLVGPSGRDPVTAALDPLGALPVMLDPNTGISLAPTLASDFGFARLSVWPGGVLGLSF